MTNKIKDLRMQGLLTEAYATSKEILEAHPDNVWDKRNFGWVCFDIAKKGFEEKDFEIILEKAAEIKQLELQSDDMILEQLSWLFGKVLRQIESDVNLEVARIYSLRDLEILEGMKLMHNSSATSFLALTLHKMLRDTEHYGHLIDVTGLDFFRNEDFKKSVLKDGTVIMPLAEQLCTSYSRFLIEKVEDPKADIETLKEVGYKLSGFLPKLARIMKLCPDFTNAFYYLIHFQILKGEYKEVRELLLPKAKEKNKEPLVWYYLGLSLKEENVELAMSCFCKAMMLHPKVRLQVRLNKELLQIFAVQGLYAEAKTEMVTIQNLVKKENLKEYFLDFDSYDVVESEWNEINQTKGNENNYDFYRKHTDETLYYIYQHKIRKIMIFFVNPEKKIANYMTQDEKMGFFKYDRILHEDPTNGDTFEAIFNSMSPNSFSSVMIMRPTEDLDEVFIRKVSADIKINNSGNFGFIDGAFVSKDMIDEYGLKHGEIVSATLVKMFNKKKNAFGWKVLSIDR